MTNIKEKAIKAARIHYGIKGGDEDPVEPCAYTVGYSAGYEAAKAEYLEKSPVGTAHVTEKVER